MSENAQNQAIETNLSAPADLPARPKRIQVPGGRGAVIVDGSFGEVLGQGAIGFWAEEDVDRGRFVNLF